MTDHRKRPLTALYLALTLAALTPATGGAKSFSSSRPSSATKTFAFGASSRPGYFNSVPRNNYAPSLLKNYAGGAFKSNRSSVSTKFGKSYNSTLEQQYSRQTAQKSFEGFQKAFPAEKPRHFPEADLQKYRSRYADNGIYQQATHDQDAWGTRERYYRSQPPVIVNGGSDTFGMLSGLFLYKLLNNPASAGEYAYNHQNDADYLKWRAEADRLAKDNADLKAQLAKLDSAKNSQGGAAPNPNWLPNGVPAAAVMSDTALKASQADFKVCVGSEGGPYYKVAQKDMLPELIQWVNLNPIITKGTPEIMAKLASGDCDAGFIQGDSRFNNQQLDVVFKPFLEAGHLACNAATHAKTIGDMADKTLWIPQNSGSRMTWDRFVELNPVYSKVTVKNAVNYEDAILKAVQGNDCLFYMAAPHAAAIDRLIDRKELKLLAIDDVALLKGGVYKARTLSSSDYSQAIQSSLLSDNYVPTVTTPATFVISMAWKNTHPDLAAKIALKLSDLEKQITRDVKQ
ncbi:MAG: hypothetical protein PHU14_03280 [Methylovulum sp.]|nr:hypothetical protein [Methylovulum sp.]